jgi:hypothetical protein
VARRTPRQKRFLGLWTAGWLAVLLLAGLLVAGDVRVQWPVFAVPLLWALVAVRPRRGGYGEPGSRRRGAVEDDLDDVPGFWDDPQTGAPPAASRWSPPPSSPPPAPPTRETGVLPPLPPRPDQPRPR